MHCAKIRNTCFYTLSNTFAGGVGVVLYHYHSVITSCNKIFHCTKLFVCRALASFKIHCPLCLWVFICASNQCIIQNLIIGICSICIESYVQCLCFTCRSGFFSSCGLFSSWCFCSSGFFSSRCFFCWCFCSGIRCRCFCCSRCRCSAGYKKH